MWTHILFDDGGNVQRNKTTITYYTFKINPYHGNFSTPPGWMTLSAVFPLYSAFFIVFLYLFSANNHSKNTLIFRRMQHEMQHDLQAAFIVFISVLHHLNQSSIVQFWGALYPYISDTAKTLASISMRLPSFTGADSIIPDAIDWSIASLLSPVTGMDSRQ